MLNLKSAYYYFLATRINIFKIFRKIYFSTSSYNKSLYSIIPEKLYFFPSPFLLSSFTNHEDFSFKVLKVDPDLFWAKDNKSINGEKINNFLWLNLIDRKNDSTTIQKIITSWIYKNKKYKKSTWNNANISKRIISWIFNSDIILKNTNLIFKEEFFKSLITQINHLKKNIRYEYDYPKKLEALTAILISGLVFKECFKNYEDYIRELEKIIDNFFDKDGYPLNKNPNSLLKCSKYLILLKECIKSAQQHSPDYLDEIVDKIINCLKSLSSPDKRLPLINGTTLINISEYLNYIEKLKYSYGKNKNKVGNIQILKFKKNFIYFDTGSPPEKKFSKSYQSGPLSFEYFLDGEKIITNCGYGLNISRKAKLLSRLTSAQSTLCINDTSVIKFERNKIINSAFGNSIKSSFKVSNITNEDNDLITSTSASHDAYENNFGCNHFREINIDKKTNILYGMDKIINNQIGVKKKFCIFFHLFPGISAVPTLGGNSILIHIKKNKSLIFQSSNQNLSIEKSIFLGGNKILNNKCISIIGDIINEKKIISWEIKKTT